jgi:hypothetical protein
VVVVGGCGLLLEHWGGGVFGWVIFKFVIYVELF